VDYGFVGNIDSVNVAVVNKLLADGLMPVVSPPVGGLERHIAQYQRRHSGRRHRRRLVGGKKLVLCTGAQGILERAEDPSSVVSYTDIKGLKRLRDEGALKDGMLPKAAAIENAIRGRRAPGTRHQLQVHRQFARGDLHQRGHRHPGGGGSHGLDSGGTTERVGRLRLGDHA